MPEVEVAGLVAQFGVAGLIGWMWLTERRSALSREKQLNEAHEQVIDQKQEISVLVDVVKANTRAVTALEAGQRRLMDMIEGKMVQVDRVEGG